MTTVINNPGTKETPVVTPVIMRPSGAGPIVAILIAVGVVLVFFAYILPFIRGVEKTKDQGIDLNVKLPEVTMPTPAPSVIVPAPEPTPIK